MESVRSFASCKKDNELFRLATQMFRQSIREILGGNPSATELWPDLNKPLKPLKRAMNERRFSSGGGAGLSPISY